MAPYYTQWEETNVEVLEFNPEEIIEDERQRKDYGDVSSLAESMKIQQIHPIRITREKKLVAGGRRLRAAKMAKIKILAIYIEDTDPADLLELELMENLERKDMTWQERDTGLARLHELRQSRHGAATAGRHDRGWSLGDTARLTNDNTSTVHDAVQMAKAMQVFPELAAAKSHNEAKKRLNKITEKLAIAELASRRKDSVVNNQALLADENFIVGDAFEGMKNLQAESVDFINCDTPYGIDLTGQKKINSGVRTDDDYVEWDKGDYVSNILLISSECFRVLKNDSWMLFWYGQEWYSEVRTVLESVGFKVDKIPAVWFGGAGGAQSMAPDVNLARSYEQFFICRKGSPFLVKRGRINVFAFDKVAPQNKIHPTEKPIALMDEIYDTFVLPGHICLSPFIGSGNDGRSAYKHGCHWFGFDLNQDVKNRFLLRVDADIKEGLYGADK